MDLFLLERSKNDPYKIIAMEQTDKATHIVLMINNSRGSAGMESHLREAINSFLTTFPEQSNLKFSIALYNRNVQWIRTAVGRSPALLNKGELKISQSNSSLYDCIYETIGHLEEENKKKDIIPVPKTYLIIQVDADDKTSNMTAREIKKELKRKNKEGWTCMMLSADKLRLPLAEKLELENNFMPYRSKYTSRAFKTAAIAVKGHRSSFGKEELEMNLSTSPPGTLLI